MSKIKHVYVVGDSFSFGQELGGSDVAIKDFFKFTPYMRTHSYTGIIADKWGVTNYTNLSFPGGSNDRIHRLIFTEFPKLLKFHKPEELFVFISMTHASRREFYDSKFKTYSPFICNFEPPKENKYVHLLWETYILNFNNPHENSNRYISQVLSIQSFLKNMGIDYIMTKSMNDHESDDIISNFSKEILSLIDRKHFPDILPFNNYVGRLGLPFGKYHHPLEEGHEAWAKYIMQYMHNNNIGEI